VARRTDRTARLTAVLAVLALVLPLTGCGGDDDDRSLLGDDQRVRVTALEARAQEQRIMDQRVRAVRDRDLDLFLRRVDHGDSALMTRQRRTFRNLVQLPLATFGYRVLDRQWDGVALSGRWGNDLHVPQIELSMQLEGYDAVPVTRTVGFVFSFTDGRATIVSDRTDGGKPLFAGAPAPWDLTAITVREEPGVLGIFDRATSSSAASVTTAVREGVHQLQHALPFRWSGNVVVYNVQSSNVLASFTDVPGGALDHLGALAFPTYAGNSRSQVASTRMLVMPSSVRAGQPFLGRITRHELSHVAIGTRDDGAPAWVSEGIAEYLGARDIPLRDRIIPTMALSRAQTGDSAMPDSRTFNNTDQEWHYALSWMACDYVADTFGESRLWELVDAMHNAGEGTADAAQDRVLAQVVGFDSLELGRRASARIRNLYG
jgi:hypothetical protein